MRTMRRSEDTVPRADPLGRVVPAPSNEARRAEARRRIGTLAFFGALAIAVASVATNVADVPNPRGEAAPAASPPPGTSPLPAGTYRLPGLSTPVTITVPDGWFAGDSVWGPPGAGVAAISTGRLGARVSIAILDLERLLPVDAVTGVALDRPAGPAWFRRSSANSRSQVQSRIRDHVVGEPVTWRPAPALAWLLGHTVRGRIDVAEDIVYGGLAGDLVSFSFPGPTRGIFDMPGGGTIVMRPGTKYTFWLPEAGAGAGGLMLGVARELGAVPDAAEWDVVRTLRLGP